MLVNRTTRRYYGAACGSWSCPTCARVKRRQLVRRIHLGLGSRDAALAARRPRLLTLTMPPGMTFPEACAALTRRFELLRLLVLRQHGVRIDYLAVVERGTRGGRRLHVHVLMRGPWLPQAEWSRLAERAGFGPVVDIRAIRNDGLAAYAVKALGAYLSKSMDETWPPHFRRLRVSRHWSPDWVVYRPASRGEWSLVALAPAWAPVDFVSRLLSASRARSGEADP